MADSSHQPSGGPLGTTGAHSARLVYRRVPTWVHRLGRGKVILAAPAVAPITLQGPGVAVWTALDRPGTCAQITTRLQDIDGLPPAPLIADTVLTLLEAGLIESIPR